MSFQKFKSNSYCVGRRHHSSKINLVGEITSKVSKILIGYCSVCNRTKSMIVSHNTIEGEGSSDFFKNVGKKGLIVSKKMAKTY